MFRNSDPVENETLIGRNTDVKTEPEEDIPELVPEIESPVTEDKNSTDLNGSEKKPHFVQVKNREVFDYEPTADSIHASLWPHWWLRAVQSRHKLRKVEAKKNVRFQLGLQDLLREAVEVRTIKEKRKIFLFL